MPRRMPMAKTEEQTIKTATVSRQLLKWSATALCCWGLLPWTAASAPSVKLTAYPQKMRSFFTVNGTNTPLGLRTHAAPLPVAGITAAARATDGAIWLGTTQGVMRLDFSSPARDRYQYMAGRRYLPDDEVAQIVADAKNGTWVRTRTGISHIELRAMTLAQKAEFFEQR